MFNAHVHLHPGFVPTTHCAINSTTTHEWAEVAKFAKKYPDLVTPNFGVHPWFAHDADLAATIQKLRYYLLKYPHAGVGEIGLDKSRGHKVSYPMQIGLFRAQLQLACQLNRVVTVHCVRAWRDVIQLLEEARPARLLIHGWRGPAAHIPALNALGAYFSVSEQSFQNQPNSNWFLSLPMNRLLLESDSAPDAHASMRHTTSLMLNTIAQESR